MIWQLFQQAFEMCCIKEFNLLYDCLTSYAVCDKLRNLKKINPEFWKELTAASVPDPTNEDRTFEEDIIDGHDMSFDDDSDLPCNMIIDCTTGSGIPENISATADDNLISVAEAESIDEVGESSTPLQVPDSEVPLAEEALGPGKRKRQAYKASTFWHHHDNDDLDEELEVLKA